MDAPLLNALTIARDDQALLILIRQHDLNITTLQDLKQFSAQHYFQDPPRALQLAVVANRLGLLLPAPAPALGRWTLANAYMFAGRYHEAVDLFSQSRTIYLQLGQPLLAAQMGVGQVWALAYIGQPQAAVNLAHEILPILTQASEQDQDDLRRLGGLYNNLGIAYDLLGQYEEALGAYNQKLNISQALEDTLQVARTQQNRARVLTYLNAFKEASQAFTAAENGLRDSGVQPDLARLYFNWGMLQALWSRHAEAEMLFGRSEIVWQETGGNQQGEAFLTVYLCLNRLMSGQEIDDLLFTRLEQAQAILTIQGPLLEAGLATLASGRYYLLKHNLEAAQVLFSQALAIAEQGGGQVIAWQTLHLLAQTAEARENWEKALDLYTRSMVHIETMRQQLLTETFRAGFLADKLTVYQDCAALYYRLGNLEQTYAVVERARARLLSERLASRLYTDIHVLRRSENKSVQMWADQLQEDLEHLDLLSQQARRETHGSETENLWQHIPRDTTLVEIEQLEAKIVKLTRQIQQEQPLFSPLATGYTISLKEIQPHLCGCTLLYYYIAQGKVHCLVIDDAGIQAHQNLAALSEIDVVSQQLIASIEHALGLAANYGRSWMMRFLPTLLTDAQTHLQTLYQLLLAPLKPLVMGSHLIISPDGPLHNIPFQALCQEKDNRVRFLIEDFTISIIPSATTLHLCLEAQSSGRGLLALGYGGERLNAVTKEIEMLTQLFPETTAFTEDKATAIHFIDESPAYRLIHLAAHAHFRHDNWMLSAFSLADRSLTLAEISQLQLHADLITLSGCDTGLGRLLGNDLVSLSAGFLAAGARSLLVSLWQVDDDAAMLFMRVFYTALQTGTERASALRQAQLHLLNLSREQSEIYGHLSHPAYWAPFQLVGDWKSLSLLELENDT